MPKRESAPIGAPCWIDLMTSDTDASRAFYTELFGWTAEEGNPEFGGYFNFTKDGIRVAGGMHHDGSDGMPDLWSIYLATDDAAATVEAATARGGQVIVPIMAVGDIGTMAVVTDAGGAGIGIWQPGTHEGFGILAETGAPAWFELFTRDYQASVDFYREVFMCDPHSVGDTDEFRYTTLNEGEQQLAGIMDAAAFLPDGVPAHWSVYFAIDNTDDALKEVVRLGGKVVVDAEDTPYGRLATATDPTGATFKLLGPSAAS